MPRRLRLDLSTFGGKLLDGLDFCREVYDFFDQVKRSTHGVARLRLRPRLGPEKKLVEELIPISRYIQARYREGRRIRVRWFGGSQPYDAILFSSGELVKHRMAPRRALIEVTTTVHPNEHLARKLLQDRGGSFGVKGISQDKKTGVIVSRPHVFTSDENITDLAAQIIERIRNKSAKPYPPETVLVVNCVPNLLIYEDEWNEAIERVKESEAHRDFREVYVVEANRSFSASFYGNRKRIRRKVD